jgi:hypothetical protein
MDRSLKRSTADNCRISVISLREAEKNQSSENKSELKCGQICEMGDGAK